MHLLLLIVLGFLVYFFGYRRLKKVSKEEKVYIKRCITFSVILYLVILFFTSDDTVSKLIYSGIVLFALYGFNKDPDKA